jgi:hypothetical protein
MTSQMRATACSRCSHVSRTSSAFRRASIEVTACSVSPPSKLMPRLVASETATNSSLATRDRSTKVAATPDSSSKIRAGRHCQRGLADASGADHRREPVRRNRLEQRRDLRDAADYRSKLGERRSGRRGGWSALIAGIRRSMHVQPVAAADDGRNELGARPAFAQGPSQGSDRHLQIVVVDEGVRPGGGDELFLADQSAVLAGECQEHVHRPPSE